MKLTKQTVYIPVKVERHRNYHIFDLNECDGSFIRNVAEESGYFFTPEQLNEYVENIIRQTLQTAADKAKVQVENVNVGHDYEFTDTINVVQKQSITSIFEETFKKFKV